MRNNHVEKPVPNMECLKYHGTPEKPDIKIFVSHRIDLDSQTVNHPMFIPVRCGAVFDNRQEVTLLGDDSGDNISDKRLAFNELTVHYWAWKNVDADYYGLCHYRRYFSFSKEPLLGTDNWGQVNCDRITDKNLESLGIISETVCGEIQACDVILPEHVEFKNIGYYSNTAVLKDLKNAYNMADVAILWTVLKEKYPDYYEDAMEYMRGSMSWLYNSFIMKKEIFFAYSEWLFDILFEFEKRINMSAYSLHMIREPAHLAERLLGIYIYHLKKTTDFVIKEKQFVKFNNTEAEPSVPTATELSKKGLRSSLKKIVMPVFKTFNPYGSRRYRFIKGAYFKLRGWQYNPQVDTLPMKQETAFRRAAKRILPPSADTIQQHFDKIPKYFNRIPGYTYETILKLSCLSLEIQATHRETFGPYKYCNEDKDVVLLATGPTLSYYSPIQRAKHIGVNGACKYNKVPLDYFFMQDCTSIGATVELDDLINLKCDKFLGVYCARHPNEPGGSEFIARTIGAKRYFICDVSHRSQIPFNIEFFPLMDYGSITFAALNFALHTHPKRIFIVGSDASTEYGEHFNGAKGADIIRCSIIIKGYKLLKQHIDAFFPEIEVIIVNPVGLRGIFSREVYTQPFLEIHPEVKEELGQYCTLLSDIAEVDGDKKEMLY